jgi:hypothetical protein
VHTQRESMAARKWLGGEGADAGGGVGQQSENAFWLG